MSVLLDSRYQFDRTGTSPENLVQDELHMVPQQGARVIVAREGVFYTQGAVLRNSATDQPLTLGQDYHWLANDPEITAKTGLDTATGAEFINPNVYGGYYLTYQCVGGVEGRSNALIQNLIEAIEHAKDNPIDWNKIIGKEAQYPPEWHPHHVLDIEGGQVVGQAIQGLKNAIMDSRPLTLTGLNLHYQDDRILNLISNFTDRLNLVYSLIADLDFDVQIQTKVDNAIAKLQTDLWNDLTALLEQRLATIRPLMEAEIEERVYQRLKPDMMAELKAYIKALHDNDGEEPPVEVDIYDMGQIVGVPTLQPGEVYLYDQVDCGFFDLHDIYDAGEIGVTPVPTGDQILLDGVDLGDDVTVTVYDHGVVSGSPVLGPDETLDQDLYDCGFSGNTDTITLLNGDTIDAGGVSGPSPVTGDQVYLNDSIDLNNPPS